MDTGADDVSAEGSVAAAGGEEVRSDGRVVAEATDNEVRSSRGGEMVADSRHRGDVETDARW